MKDEFTPRYVKRNFIAKIKENLGALEKQELIKEEDGVVKIKCGHHTGCDETITIKRKTIKGFLRLLKRSSMKPGSLMQDWGIMIGKDIEPRLLCPNHSGAKEIRRYG